MGKRGAGGNITARGLLKNKEEGKIKDYHHVSN